MSFLTDYKFYTNGDEAPENYHTWSAIATMASIMGRRVWVNWGRFRIFPNLYVVLLGPPGNGKTSGLSVAKGLIRELANIPFSAEAQTKESLCKEMPDNECAFRYGDTSIIQTPISIFVTELSHFLGPASGHMIDFLTTIYDQDVYDTKTKGKGCDLIIGPCVNLLACTTPAWITTYLKSDIISGGFTRRAVMVNETEASVRIAFPNYTEEQITTRAKLITTARKMQDIIGEFHFSETSRKWLTEWYLGHERPENEKTRWYYRTKHIQLLKVAMLVACSELSHPILETSHLRTALDVLEKIEKNLPAVFIGMGRNELYAVAERIMDTIESNEGAIQEKRLKSIFYQDANFSDLGQMVEHLVGTDRLVRRHYRIGKDPTARCYLCTPKAAERLDSIAKVQAEGHEPPAPQSPEPSDDSASGSPAPDGQS